MDRWIRWSSSEMERPTRWHKYDGSPPKREAVFVTLCGIIRQKGTPLEELKMLTREDRLSLCGSCVMGRTWREA